MKQRVYIEVIAKFNIDGDISPLAVVWTDGRKYHIDKVIGKSFSVSETGMGGLRFQCLIGGKERYLFIEDKRDYRLTNARWFVEVSD